jgi:hypothetical protein
MLGRGDEADYPLGADVYPFTAITLFSVGAELARDGVVSGDIYGERVDLIAGKPCSYGEVWWVITGV